MHRVPPCILILPVVVIRHDSCKQWLFTGISFRAGIGGRGAGEFVKSERERQNGDGGIEPALSMNIVVSNPVSHTECN